MVDEGYECTPPSMLSQEFAVESVPSQNTGPSLALRLRTSQGAYDTYSSVMRCISDGVSWHLE